ncbi:MAG TPA: cupin domain-containing protein [Acidimicrobiales bacterium]|nr:cupin domain-containing protein [Acidimicrobiales bacterium]
MFETKPVPVERDVVAPDGSDVRVLLGVTGGTLAEFELAPGAVSVAVQHRSVEEIWFVVSGWGALWRQLDDQDEVVDLDAGVSVTIPVGTSFQFRCDGDAPLRIVAVTMPPWPGDGEAVRVPGRWAPTVQPGPGLG